MSRMPSARLREFGSRTFGRRRFVNRFVGTVVAGCLFALMLLAIPVSVHAQLPDSPRRFVDFLDTRCYQITNQPPLNLPLRLDHLNPVLLQMGLPFEDVILQEPQQ